jgi:hypothetical protein
VNISIMLKFCYIFKRKTGAIFYPLLLETSFTIFLSNLLYACVWYVCPFSILSICSKFPDHKCGISIRVIKCTPLRCYPFLSFSGSCQIRTNTSVFCRRSDIPY